MANEVQFTGENVRKWTLLEGKKGETPQKLFTSIR
jgi:hypothetical protein